MTCRHAAEKISYHSCISLVISLAAGMLNVGPGWAHAFSQLALELPFSRECELEADAVGLRIMSRACFEPSAAPRAMARLDQLAHGGGSGGGGGGGVAGAVSSYLSTHPPSQARVKVHDACVFATLRRAWFCALLTHIRGAACCRGNPHGRLHCSLRPIARQQSPPLLPPTMRPDTSSVALRNHRNAIQTSQALHDGQTGALELYEGAGCSQRRQGWRMSMKGAEDFET